jgi:hypothetical protein
MFSALAPKADMAEPNGPTPELPSAMEKAAAMRRRSKPMRGWK